MIAEWLVLKKKLAEINFKNEYLKLKNEKTMDTKEIINKIEELENEIGYEIVLPYEEKINELDKKIKEFSIKDQIEAIKTKKGQLYELIKEKGNLIKKNLENKDEIEELNKIIHSLTILEIKKELINQIKKGEIDINLEELNIIKIQEIFNALNKAGIKCKINGKNLGKEGKDFEEEKIVIKNKTFWLEKEKANEVKRVLEEYEKISVKIQLKNVERQVKEEENDEEFEKLQKEFLEISKKRDEIIKTLQSDL